MKASIPFLHTNSSKLYDIRYLTAFSADSIHLKKPSVGPKGLIGPPCHGAPGRRRQKLEQFHQTVVAGAADREGFTILQFGNTAVFAVGLDLYQIIDI